MARIGATWDQPLSPRPAGRALNKAESSLSQGVAGAMPPRHA
ncbi:hypothetical protein [Streptomyces sp. NPDC093097]